MNAADELLPPMQYGLAWGIIAGSLILLVLGFYIAMLIMTKRMKPEESIIALPGMANSHERLSLIKNKYAEDIMLVGTLHKNGEITTRRAFQSLSIHLRNFTHEYSRSGAHAMTLLELDQRKAPALLKDKIQNFYPIAFEEAERTGNVESAVQDALQVIQLWH